MLVLWFKSKILRSIPLIFGVSVQILQFFTNAGAQDLEIRVKIEADQPANARVGGIFKTARTIKSAKNMSFLMSYAGIAGLGERVSEMRLADKNGLSVESKRLIAGEYLAESEFRSWSYKFSLEPLSNAAAAAHLSWIADERGVIMLDDLLPQLGPRTSARVSFELPAGWTVSSVAEGNGAGVFDTPDIEKAVFYLGRQRREKELEVGKSRLKLGISGAWRFTDDEAATMAASVFREYTRIFGSAPDGDFIIDISKFPSATGFGRWEADTRGSSVTIVSSDMPFKTQSLQRLHEQLRHELFHLWIPNGVNLSGSYDWFYEGFALYQSLKLGVAVNRLRFDDFLDTLSRAYDIDSMQAKRMSLVDASRNRWNGANTQIYARGMLVAFMCDLTLLENSRGKRSVTDMNRRVFERHRLPNPAADGTESILTILRSERELTAIIDGNITGVESLNWTRLLNAAGIQPKVRDQVTRLTVMPKLSGHQKDLLDKLGYNNWRKLAESNK
ncbi:MAG: hypothetical protein ABIV48_07275 [Pyrinomonadaceae bacterium]